MRGEGGILIFIAAVIKARNAIGPKIFARADLPSS
jgi:hypothetical protein